MEWSLGDIAGLLAALAFAYLVFRLGSVIGKAGRILDETRVSLRTTTDNVQPTLQGLTETVSLTNDQLARVDGITTSVSTMTTNASALTSLFAATLGSPLVKVAAFSFGVRTALAGSGGVHGRRRRRASVMGSTSSTASAGSTGDSTADRLSSRGDHESRGAR
jgi:hypothetical protein